MRYKKVPGCRYVKNDNIRSELAEAVEKGDVLGFADIMAISMERQAQRNRLTKYINFTKLMPKRIPEDFELNAIHLSTAKDGETKAKARKVLLTLNFDLVVEKLQEPEMGGGRHLDMISAFLISKLTDELHCEVSEQKGLREKIKLMMERIVSEYQELGGCTTVKMRKDSTPHQVQILERWAEERFGSISDVAISTYQLDTARNPTTKATQLISLARISHHQDLELTWALLNNEKLPKEAVDILLKSAYKSVRKFAIKHHNASEIRLKSIADNEREPEEIRDAALDALDLKSKHGLLRGKGKDLNPVVSDEVLSC